MNLLDTASLVVTPNGYKASKLYSIIPSDGSGDMTFARTGDTATRVNSSGLIETVTANKPRLDYLGSTCPKLLLEPQRTNLVLYSQEFDNAGWTKLRLNISANNAVSPDGTTNADKLEEIDGVTGDKQISQVFSQTAGAKSYSVFAKKSERSNFSLVTSGGGLAGDTTIFNLTNGSVTSGTGAITSYGNDWYRCTQFFTTTDNTSVTVRTRLISGGSTSYAGVSGYGLFVYGAQLEAGAYATSYIPTTTASVTRNADLASKTGISSLIGQTEGTLFVNANISNFSEARRGIVLYADANNFITLRISSGNDLQFLVFGSGAIQANFTIANPQGNVKMALAYKANDFAAYLNGTLVGTDTSGTVPATSGFYLGYDPSGTNQLAGGVNQAILFKTRLQNAELATLTSL
jgi:hypothetical protein